MVAIGNAGRAAKLATFAVLLTDCKPGLGKIATGLVFMQQVQICTTIPLLSASKPE
jgi:hypothetical protein